MEKIKKIWLYALIPCGFTLLNLLFYGLQLILIHFGIDVNILIVSVLVVTVSTFIVWTLVGHESYAIQKSYGKALLYFNGIGIFCLLFALIYYVLVQPATPLEGFNYMPVGFTDVPVFDLFANLYANGFFFGSVVASLLLNKVSYPLVAVVVNTLIGMSLFTAGYVVHSFSAKREASAINKVKETMRD